MPSTEYLKQLHNIRTTYSPKPIPNCSWDWQACNHNWDLGMPLGFGPTERDAIEDLLIQMEG